jgi:3-phosphoshikimate 1-carboxyvinyltransferase
MTRRVMADFGAACLADGPTRWSIPAGRYLGRSYATEPDASAASYFLAAAAITGGSVTVEGLSRRSMQGDVDFATALERMGCTVEWHESGDHPADDAVTVSGRAARGIDIDMNAISDTVPTLGVVALFADGPCVLRNIGSWRVKETDRIAAMAAELRKLGAAVETTADSLRVTPPPSLRAATIDTYDDHRMAMCFSLAALGGCFWGIWVNLLGILFIRRSFIKVWVNQGSILVLFCLYSYKLVFLPLPTLHMNKALS